MGTISEWHKKSRKQTVCGWAGGHFPTIFWHNKELVNSFFTNGTNTCALFALLISSIFHWPFKLHFAPLYIINYVYITVFSRPVVPGGDGGAMAPPDFGKSVNPISTRGGRLCPPNNTGTHGFSDLPTALQNITSVTLRRDCSCIN